MSVIIKEVESKKDLKKFINFQYELYKGNKYWCPQLRMSEWVTLKKGSPSFDYCDARYFLAYKDHKIVGRVAAIVNHKSNEVWKEKRIRFGWIDFIDDLEVSKALIKAVEDWGKELGLNQIHGPLGFTDMDNEGMLIKGFEELSSIFALYNYPYYVTHMEQLGFLKDVDWLQNEFTIPKEIPEKLERMAKLVQEKYGLTLLKVPHKKDLLRYGVKMFHTLNDAFNVLYGFVPLTDRQIKSYVDQYFGFIDKRFVQMVVDKDDNVVGFGVSAPSLTKAIQKCNGRLFPLGWWYLLRAFKKHDIIEMYLNGVTPEYQGKGAVALYYYYMAKAYLDAGFKTAVSSLQLEENAKALTIWKNFEHRQHITHRCWTKDI
jgi:hypothetical protein